MNVKLRCDHCKTEHWAVGDFYCGECSRVLRIVTEGDLAYDRWKDQRRASRYVRDEEWREAREAMESDE